METARTSNEKKSLLRNFRKNYKQTYVLFLRNLNISKLRIPLFNFFIKAYLNINIFLVENLTEKK